MSRSQLASWWLGSVVVAAGIAVLVVPMVAVWAQGPDEEETTQTVARVAYLSGEVSFNRGDDPDNWQAASLNFPMTLGDRIFAATDGRVELQLESGELDLGPETELAALNLTRDTTQLSLTEGVASFRIHHLDRDEVFEVATPNVSISIDTPGYYRIDVDRDGNSHLSTWRGTATAAAGGGQIELRAGEAIQVDGIDNPRYNVESIPREDSWDHWVGQRAGRYRNLETTHYASSEVVGVEDLSESGRWEEVPGYGQVWTPAGVAADWQPYRFGRWVWQDPWGWTWVGDEPWGWAPYHYGRWITWKATWYWVPVAPTTTHVRYAPALVAFSGGGPGWSASVTIGGGGGYVGWIPLAPSDPFVPWWYHHPHTTVNVTNITYVNRTYITVVNQNTFVSGGAVAHNYVRDTTIVRQVSAAPVVKGPVPVIPTHDSLRVGASTEARVVTRPPALPAQRAVVTRIAPPPAPPRFDNKIDAIRTGGGAPVPAVFGRSISPATAGEVHTVVPVRPATSATAGQVTLAPRNPSQSRPVQAIRVPAGRPAATFTSPAASSHAVAPTPHRAEYTAPAAKPSPTPHPEEHAAPAVQARPTPHRAEYTAPAAKPSPTPHPEEHAAPAVQARPTPHRAEYTAPAAKPSPTPHPEVHTAPAVQARPTPHPEVHTAPPAQARPTAHPEEHATSPAQGRPTAQAKGHAGPAPKPTPTPLPKKPEPS